MAMRKLAVLAAAAMVAAVIAGVALTVPGNAPAPHGAVMAQTAMPAAEAVAPLGNRFVRSFKFDNATKVWLFYDPRAGDASTQKDFVINESYWILVTETIGVITLGGKDHNLSCRGDNCWNQIVW